MWKHGGANIWRYIGIIRCNCREIPLSGGTYAWSIATLGETGGVSFPRRYEREKVTCLRTLDARAQVLMAHPPVVNDNQFDIIRYSHHRCCTCTQDTCVACVVYCVLLCIQCGGSVLCICMYVDVPMLCVCFDIPSLTVKSDQFIGWLSR